MKIYSMTATFGKLSGQTLTFKPGLNIVQAPNEWGKSTWCAFLVAMLYGINTREQTKTGFLADKEHYMPWSGQPMSGRMDICWNGRDITVERRNKGRGFFNDFKAYETESGVPVEELTAANCGQTLLGVEQSVFTRAGFLRQNDLPVTADEKLRSRLNALVTTGDESGQAEELGQKLKDIKNRCRFNKTGLLPQAEGQRDQLREKLDRLQGLQARAQTIQARQEELKTARAELENHIAALEYTQNRANIEKLHQAQNQQERAAARVRELEAACTQETEPQVLQETLDRLRVLRDRRDSLHQQARLMPPAPQMPQVAEPFRGIDPETAVEQAKTSASVYSEDQSKRYFGGLWLPILLAVAGAVLLIVNHLVVRIAGIGLELAAILWLCSVAADKKRRTRTMADLCRSYQPIPPEQWVSAAKAYRDDQRRYGEELESYKQKVSHLERQMQQVNDAIGGITGDRPVSEFEADLLRSQTQRRALEEAIREEKRAQQLVQMLQSACREVSAPTREDKLTYTMEQSRQYLSRAAVEQEQLVAQLGQCQGQIKALGQQEQLELQLQQVQQRIEKLEAIYQAAVYGMQVQQAAAQELQRRFAPRISHRTQEILCKFTDGKYNRLVLDSDLQISSGAAGENTLRSNLWRSSGTADQLYLALRLAVAEELTPDAPLVLDDALVRFDETRMSAAMELLQQMAEHKQVILFTCQSRESAWEQNH